MISDGDSSAYEPLKYTYINALLKDLARSNSNDNHPSMESIDENNECSSLPHLSPE